MEEEDTIAAVATPVGIGALAIIRMSGKDAFNIFKKVVREKEKKINFRFAHNFFIEDKNKKVIDEVIAIHYKKPKTYTGEDLIEIICHGGKLVSKKIIETILENGARIAHRGEFSLRAYKNGKIELMKAESINAIIESKNEREHSIAIERYKGNYKKINEWKEKIKKEIMFLEAEIEFGDEEGLKEREKKDIEKLYEEIKYSLEIGKHIREKIKEYKITIIGPTNAGKSSLFNSIINKNKAIIHNKPGTTRDIVSETIKINEKEIEINDTAGIRNTEKKIENEGIKRSKDAIKESEIVIWISDISRKIEKVEKEIVESLNSSKTIYILNKIDKKKNIEKEKYYKKYHPTRISIKEKKEIKEVIKKISEMINENGNKYSKSEIFITKRQIHIIQEVKKEIKNSIKNWKQKEIASYYLREAMRKIEMLYGKNEDEKIINKIFEEFCIGK